VKVRAGSNLEPGNAAEIAGAGVLQKQQERAVAEAEAAWRASWFERMSFELTHKCRLNHQIGWIAQKPWQWKQNGALQTLWGNNTALVSFSAS